MADHVSFIGEHSMEKLQQMFKVYRIGDMDLSIADIWLIRKSCSAVFHWSEVSVNMPLTACWGSVRAETSPPER
ncbi:hypothetical protein JOQ06_013954 [Pogonophryne albipinna]|uniref:Uncharacterized protein n=1 Tax=Pogonophryne albipinna TaxID=1090488 RepID=A0AAD6F6D8_9TELE|nr:hypothetical protein JOQ06_013954 [Pogonophryne albipinna]